MCGSIEFGICPICKQEKPLNRKYFYYNVDCVCCGGAAKDYHFEIAYHCNDCEPIKPETIKPTLKASSYEIKEKQYMIKIIIFKL